LLVAPPGFRKPRDRSPGRHVDAWQGDGERDRACRYGCLSGAHAGGRAVREDLVFFRPARVDDAEELCGLARQLADSEGGMPERISPDWIRNNMLVSEGPVRVLVAARNGRLAGYVAWSPMVETIFASAGAYVGDL